MIGRIKMEYRIVKAVGLDEWSIVAESSKDGGAISSPAIIDTFTSYPKALDRLHFLELLGGESRSISLYLPCRLVSCVDNARGRESRSEYIAAALAEYFRDRLY